MSESARAQENKDLIERYAEKYNQNKLDELEEVLHPDFRIHNLLGVDSTLDLAGYKEYAKGVLAAFPDVHIECVDHAVEGDKIATRAMATATHKGELFGIQPTSKRVEFQWMIFCHIRDGKVYEKWDSPDGARLLQQIGGLSDQFTPA